MDVGRHVWIYVGPTDVSVLVTFSAKRGQRENSLRRSRSPDEGKDSREEYHFRRSTGI